MKKFLLLSLILGMAGVLSAGDVAGTVNTRMLNLRMQPSLHSPVVGKIKMNEKLAITGKKGSWLEVAAPAAVKVYVSRAYISDGKAITDLTMRSAMAVKAASFGKLPKGTPVKIISEHAYGWARIEPPANLRVYAASLYVQYDAGAVNELAAQAAVEDKSQKQAVPAPAEKKEVKKEQAAPAPAEKKEVKKEQPAEIPAGKTEVKKNDSANAPVKKVEKMDAKTPPAFSNSDPRVAALKELGIDVFTAPCTEVTVKGTLVPVPSSPGIATNYAIGTTVTPIIGFVCAAEDGMIKPFVNKDVQISGRQFKVKGWKSPIIWLDEIDKI